MIWSSYGRLSYKELRGDLYLHSSDCSAMLHCKSEPLVVPWNLGHYYFLRSGSCDPDSIWLQAMIWSSCGRELRGDLYFYSSVCSAMLHCQSQPLWRPESLGIILFSYLLTCDPESTWFLDNDLVIMWQTSCRQWSIRAPLIRGSRHSIQSHWRRWIFALASFVCLHCFLGLSILSRSEVTTFPTRAI